MKLKAFLSALFLLPVIIVTSCKDAYKFEEVVMPAPVVRVEKFPDKAVKVDSTVTITVLYEPTNGCGRYSDTVWTSSPLLETYQILVAYPKDQDVVCADKSNLIRYSIQYKFTRAGTQRFRFWQEDGKYLDAEVLVNPKEQTL
ncbi:hypothetical protein [Rufibacter sp. LB8]|uniref:hypothetical protein n=1 Tax=Rufibacter sp. LB8 TaxID=2777781 RepID=UPI00178C23D0|nr:hypothetical protein [Rufibacter sp. LB8]